MTPPRRLQYVGRSADFEAVGACWRDLLVDRHGLEPDGDVLDIGCGIGRNAVALVPHLTEGTYEGFDVVPQFIRWCRRNITPSHPNFHFQVAEVRNRQYNPTAGSPAAEYAFPYAAGSFDLAWAASVFTHMRPNEINRYLSEAYRVLRPGGQLVCTFFLVDPTVDRPDRRGSSAFRLDHRMSDDEGTPFSGRRRARAGVLHRGPRGEPRRDGRGDRFRDDRRDRARMVVGSPHGRWAGRISGQAGAAQARVAPPSARVPQGSIRPRRIA